MRHGTEYQHRELQVVDASVMPDVGLIACATYCAKQPQSAQKKAFLLGTQTQHADAARLGLEADFYCPAAGFPVFGWHALGRYIASEQYDCIRPWSQSVVTCCRLAARNHARVLSVPGSLHLNSSSVLAEPETNFDIGMCLGEDRRAVRQRFGISKDQPMVALLADPWWHADARRFVYMIGMLDIVDQPIAGLIDCRSAHLARAQQFHSEAAVRWNMLISKDPLCTVLHACDLAVIVPPEPHRTLTPSQLAWVSWSIFRAHLLGVPVVGAARWFEKPAYPADIRNNLAAGRGSVTDIARTLAKLAHDSTTRTALADKVRKYAQNIIKTTSTQTARDSITYSNPIVTDNQAVVL